MHEADSQIIKESEAIRVCTGVGEIGKVSECVVGA